MLIRCVLLLVFLSCVRTRNDFQSNGLVNLDSDFNSRFSLWPSVHNAAILLRNRRESQAPTNVAGLIEGVGSVKQPLAPITEHAPTTVQPALVPKIEKQNDTKESKSAASKSDTSKTEANKSDSSPDRPNLTPKETTIPEVTPMPPVTTSKVIVKDNGTNSETATKQWDLSNPGAAKRGLIVFGGFAMLAMAYFIFYRTKSKFNDANNPNGNNDTNQFRYGVLQSEDKRDNLELSRVPLTMESDDEEDEDLEIFDLEQKKKSLSYVNLQTDEDIVLSPRERDDRDNLLLDIEDANYDTLINWSNNGNKSIL